MPSGNVIALWASPDWRSRVRRWGHILWPDAAHLRGDLGLPADAPVRASHYVARWAHLLTSRRRSLRALLKPTGADVRWAGLARWLAEE